MANEYKQVISEKKIEAKRLMTDDQVTKCNIAIHTASVAAAAGAFVPIPGVDAVPITAIQVTMVLALGKVFDQKVSDSAAKGLIGAAASTFIGRSLVKLIPIAGWAASSAVAAGVTEAIGWTVAVDFAKQSSRIETVELISDFLKDAPDITPDDLEDWISTTDSFDRQEWENESEKNEENKSYSEQQTEKNNSQEQQENIIHTHAEAKCDENEASESYQDDESLSNDFSSAFGEDEE